MVQVEARMEARIAQFKSWTENQLQNLSRQVQNLFNNFNNNSNKDSNTSSSSVPNKGITIEDRTNARAKARKMTTMDLV